VLTGLAATLLAAQTAAGADWGLKPGSVELKSAGALTFGPDGVLFVGDSTAAAVYAIQTSDANGSAGRVKPNIQNLPAKIGEALGVAEADVKINDLAANPKSGQIYLSVAAGKPAQAALFRVDAEGKLSQVSLKDVPHSRAAIADAPESAVGRRGNPRDDAITDLAYREGKLLVSGLAQARSPSAVREYAFPFGEGATATYIEIYHAAHGRVEDNAAVRAFVPLVIDGEPSLLAGFTCTPLVRFPIKALEPGKKVRGTTVAELGNRNRPLDMVVYEKDGQQFALMANSARGVMKISLANIQENNGITEPVRGGGTAGQPFETIKELKGVEQLDKLDEANAIILAKAEQGSLDLTTIPLP
jgi:hypothetical protein